jgi:competence protein ComEA
MGDIFNDYRERFEDWVADLQFSANHKRALILLFVLVSIVSIAVVARGHSQPVVETAPIVDVAGAVKSPGVYSLPANSRVIDAIAAAGGAAAHADTSDINLARLIKDGEQVYVDLKAASTPFVQDGPTRNAVKKKSGPININRATAGELDGLPGIGPVLASRIIDYRKANGPFASVDDLQKVSGIGVSKFAQFKSKVRV